MSGTAGIELMRRQYLQLIEPARLHVPPLDEMRLPDTQERIYKTMFDEDIGHLPPERYRIRILKRLLHAMEEAVQDPYEDEISDDLTVALGSLMFNAPNNSTPSAEEKSFVTYSLPDPLSSYLAPGITLLESRHLIAASGTTGLRTWEAALNLGQFLHTEAGSQLVRGKRVLELGAGTGFLSILLAKHLKSDFVLATDGSGQVIDDLSANLFLNGLEDERFFKAAVMKWGHALVDDMLSDTEGRDSFDVVIGADLTYDIRVIPALVATLADLFSRYIGLAVLISTTVRKEETFQAFLNACAINRFIMEDIMFPAIAEEEQQGFFYTAEDSLRIVMIRKESGLCEVP